MADTHQTGPADGAADDTAAEDGAAYAFVRELAKELSSKTIELPGFPDVAMRVQKILADTTVGIDQLVRVIGADAVLTARVLTLANSAAYNPSTKPIANLRTAVTRLGFDALRAAVITVALAQQRNAPAFKSIQGPMTELWNQTVRVSSLCLVLARANGRVDPEAAMLAGIVSCVGKLYILTRASTHPALFRDVTAYAGIVRTWHAAIAQALLEHWQMAEEIINAVRDFESAHSELRRNPNCADVLAAASQLAEAAQIADGLQPNAQAAVTLARLGIATADCDRLLAESATEIEALRAALGA